ncbi:hypothetical protein [Burkholderia gladioli]|uniref:hypothetical protein n=1 Tax=Burkholderia gladioli TaxID=28095 RepID=UPI001640E534|nr:hypothetical protein [Burkholderia gladioli]
MNENNTTAALTDEQRIIEMAAEHGIGPTSGLGFARALLTSPRAGVPAPAGWKMVPVEATREMADSGHLAYDEHGWSGFAKIWSAMLDAAPAAPVAEPSPAENAKLASMTRMFHAACAELGLINEALGLDPDDGGAEPILDAIQKLKDERDQWADAGYAAQAVAADGAIPTPEDVQSWAVTVEVNGMTILTISDSHVGGIDSIGDFGDVVRSCAQHLTSFIGKDDAERAAVSPATAETCAGMPDEVRDSRLDSQYLAGVTAGWNAANADDPNAALGKIHASRADYLRPLRDWQKAGRPGVPASPATAAAQEHYDEIKATLSGAHAIMENVAAIERRVGPLGSHARGYTHKLTAALRHLDALAAGRVAPATAEASEPHSDDIAVDAFAAAMKAKMAAARAKGRSGWETCTPADLSRMLRDHVEKGDPRDVANFCMMLHHHGASIGGAADAGEAVASVDEATFKHLFYKHGGPVDSEGWCINESGLRDFLADLAAAQGAQGGKGGEA